MMEWLRRIIRRLLGRPEPKATKEVEPFPRESLPTLLEPQIPRTGIRSTDLGMRKLSRHRGGRLYDRRSGFDPDKRMVDIEDDQTRKGKKKKGTWAEDRKR